MKLGCCTSLADIGRLAQAGFEYAECTVSTLKPEEDDTAVAPILAQLRAGPVPVWAFNVFVPGDIKIVGPQADEARLKRYAQKAIERIHAVGGRVLVLGSGGARSVPDGFPRERAEEQFISFARTAGDIAQKNGVMIGLEAINSREVATIINTLTEAVSFARRVNHPAVKIIADVYHMCMESEPYSHISEYKDWIIHVHLADSKRGAPGTESLPWAEAFDHLHRAGYDGLMSYECRWDDFAAQAAQSMQFVRRVWKTGR